MIKYTDRMLQTWQDSETHDIHADMMRLTLQIVMKCIFNTDVDTGKAKVIATALDVAMNWFERKRSQSDHSLRLLKRIAVQNHAN